MHLLFWTSIIDRRTCGVLLTKGKVVPIISHLVVIVTYVPKVRLLLLEKNVCDDEYAHDQEIQ